MLIESPLSDALKKAAVDICFNSLLLRVESVFEFRSPTFSIRDERIASAIQRSAATGKPSRVRGPAGYKAILSGFECLAQDSSNEIGVIAWSATGNRQSSWSLAAAIGTPSSVRLPVEAVLPALPDRNGKGLSTRVLLIHNHPRNPFRDIARLFVDAPLGPSSADRSALLSWFGFAARVGLTVQPEAFLYEDGTWRQFLLPSPEVCLDMLNRVVA